MALGKEHIVIYCQTVLEAVGVSLCRRTVRARGMDETQRGTAEDAYDKGSSLLPLPKYRDIKVHCMKV